MATGTFKWYLAALLSAFNKEVDWNTDVQKIMATTSAHTPDQDVHDYKNDIVAAEVTGTNWAAGGVTLANCVMTVTGATNVFKLDADDVSVATVTATDMKNFHVYDSTPGTDATRPLLCYVVLDTALNPNAGTVSLTFDAAGIATLTPA